MWTEIKKYLSNRSDSADELGQKPNKAMQAEMIIKSWEDKDPLNHTEEDAILACLDVLDNEHTKLDSEVINMIIFLEVRLKELEAVCTHCHGRGGHYEDVVGDGGPQMWFDCEYCTIETE